MLETEPQIVEQYVATGQARIVYRHLLQLGPASVRAAEASECAGDQGAFWEMRKLLYERQTDLYTAGDLDVTLAGFAGELGMDGAAFQRCLADNTHLAAVQADYRAAQAEGVRSRPEFRIGEQRLVGALPLAQFAQAIEAAQAE